MLPPCGERLTAGYAFTDYQSQGRLHFPLLLILPLHRQGDFLCSTFTLHSLIRLLRDFDDELFRMPLDMDLAQEDERLDAETLQQCH
jgi:hypothetical protein